VRGLKVWLSAVYISLRSERHRFFTDLELQLLLKQGQVEVDAHGFIRNYRHCVLIHRNVIEELNQQIKVSFFLSTDAFLVASRRNSFQLFANVSAVKCIRNFSCLCVVLIYYALWDTTTLRAPESCKSTKTILPMSRNNDRL